MGSARRCACQKRRRYKLIYPVPGRTGAGGDEFVKQTRAGRSRRATQQLTKPAKGGRRPMRKPVTKIAGFTIPPVDRFRLPTDDTDDDERYSHLKAIYRRRLYMSLAAFWVCDDKH